MSVNASPAYSGPYLPNGVVTAFSFNFPCQSAADVAVLQNDVALTTGFAITLNADQLDSPGGVVTFTTAPLTGSGLVKIVSEPVLYQEAAFEAGVPWNAAATVTQNGANDRAVIVAQALARDVARALLLPIGDGAGQLPQSAARSYTLLGFGANGALTLYPQASVTTNAIQLIEVATSGATLAANQYYALKTSLGNLAPVLPELSQVLFGAAIEIQDIDFEAFTHNQVIAASGSDTITYQDQEPAETFTMNENGVCLRFVANGSTWRAIYYGG
jgi:hypothetical protein